MTDVELLAVLRGSIAIMGFVFAVRAHMWLLATAWFSGVVASVCLASGLALVVSGIAAMPLYAALGMHTLFVTRFRRTDPYIRRRSSSS